MYVWYTAYNNLVRDYPELGWLSKHSEASVKMHGFMSGVRDSIHVIHSSLTCIPAIHSPVIEEAILDLQLYFQRNDITKVEQAWDRFDELHGLDILKDLSAKIAAKTSVIINITPYLARKRSVELRKAS